MYMDLSHGMKVNKFAHLTTSQFVSEYPVENPNIVWSGSTWKLVRTSTNHSICCCCCFFVCRLESELNCQLSCVVILHSQSSAHLSHLHWIKTQGPLGCEHFGITVSCSWFADVILRSLVFSAEPKVFPGY